jgi:hypothetical protein
MSRLVVLCYEIMRRDGLGHVPGSSLFSKVNIGSMSRGGVIDTIYWISTLRVLQGRYVELMYINYYTEQYGTLGLALTAADLLHPTDVIVNFGVWLSDTPSNTSCGATPSHWPNIGRCPYMHDVCEYFLDAEQKRSFNLWWSTTTPGLDGSRPAKMIEKVPLGHNLNAVSACGCELHQRFQTCVCHGK